MRCDRRSLARRGREAPDQLRRAGLGFGVPVLACLVAIVISAATPRAAQGVEPGAGSSGTAGPTTTAPWPTPGYSEAELRPVVEALLQLATGASPGPTVAPPDPAPSSTPRTTEPGRAIPDARPARPVEASPAHRLPGWVMVALLLVALSGIGVLVTGVVRRRGRHGRRHPARAEATESAPDSSTDDGSAPVSHPTASPIAGRVDLALRHAWAALRHGGRVESPSVLAVQVGESGIEVLLAVADVDAPGRFVASDDRQSWTLPANVSDEDLRRPAGDQPAPFPGLVTVGATPEGPVLVDLLHAGTLSVEGDAAMVGAFLAGAALELATAPWAQALTLGLLGGDDRLAELAGVEKIGTHGGSVAEWLQATSKVTAVVIAPGMAGPEHMQRMAEVVGSRSGRLGLVAPGPVPATSWRLVIAADGHGVLHPLGLELACALDAEAVSATVGALRMSTVPPPVGQTSPGGPPTEASLDGPGVAVLGPVVLRWPAVVGARRPTRRKLEEVVAYLATHPERPVPAERLRTAIWPLSDDERAGEVADSSFRATISRTRSALGMAPTGRPYLPEAQDGCYQLDASFGCDWVDFAGLVDRARSAPAPEAIALLSEALTLVRGAPFADAPRGAFSWAWSEQLVSAIEVAVADAAERLADLALNAGDHATARWAAGKGLLVVPGRESLYRARMRAAFEAGDIDDIEQAWTEVRRAARGLGDAEEPQGETTALYERLRRAARPGTTDVTAGGARRLAPVP